MRWLKMFIVLLLCVAIGFVGVMFTIHNTEKVSIDLIFVTLPQASLSLWLIASFVLGGFLGFILSGMAIVALKTRLMTSRRKVASVTKELEQFRNTGTALKETT